MSESGMRRTKCAGGWEDEDEWRPSLFGPWLHSHSYHSHLAALEHSGPLIRLVTSRYSLCERRRDELHN